MDQNHALAPLPNGPNKSTPALDERFPGSTRSVGRRSTSRRLCDHDQMAHRCVGDRKRPVVSHVSPSSHDTAAFWVVTHRHRRRVQATLPGASQAIVDRHAAPVETSHADWLCEVSPRIDATNTIGSADGLLGHRFRKLLRAIGKSRVFKFRTREFRRE